MKPWQTVVKYGAIAFAVILIVNLAVWAITAFGFMFGLSSSVTSDEAETFEFDAEIDVLEIDISAAALTLRAEKCDNVTVTTNLKKLTAEEKDGKLIVKERQGKAGFLTVTDNDAFVEIVYPVGIVFDKVDIDSGAGRLELSSVYTRELDLDLGAGEAILTSLTVTQSADIDGGAGALTVTDSMINNFDLDMGIGELILEAELYEKCDISLGVGEADITLFGGKDKYGLVLEKGIGEIKVDGEKVGNTKLGEGECKVDIDGGVGEINIKFW